LNEFIFVDIRETARHARSAAVVERALSRVGFPYVGPIFSFSRTSLNSITEDDPLLLVVVLDISLQTFSRALSIYSSGSIPTKRSWAKQERKREAAERIVSSLKEEDDEEEEAMVSTKAVSKSAETISPPEKFK